MRFLALLFLASACACAAAMDFDLAAEQPFTVERGRGFDLGTAPDADNRPFFFSVAVPEGNWRVTVTFGDEHAASANTVKAESRRLMLENVATRSGEFVTRSLIVNVRTPRLVPPEKNAPGGTAVLLNDREAGSLSWDDKLTLEFGGAVPRVRRVRIEPAEVPTVFLLGDSTVTDQRWEPGASWGQMLPRFFQPTVAIANHAESGETLKSFVTGLRLAKVLSQLRAGDWVLIQFGHNDQKKQWPQTYSEARTTYRAWLRAFIAEVRLRGATPVLVTSPHRRTFDAQGRVTNTHGDYPQAVRDTAAEEKVALIDLERMSVSLYEALGPARSVALFSGDRPEITHHNNYGAYELALCVAQGLREARGPLATSLTADFAGFDPARPDDPSAFAVPASPQWSSVTPRGN